MIGLAVGGAVEGHLDGQDLGVLGGLLDELDHGAERLVRVVDQDVGLANGGEDALAGGHAGRHLRLEGRLLELAEPLELVQAGQHREVHRAGHLVDVAFLQLERRGREQLGEEALVGAVRDLQPDRGAPLPLPERLLDGREQAALDLVLLDRQVAVAGGAEGDPLDDAVAAEEGIEPRADHVLEQDEPPLAVALVRQWDQPVDHRRDLEHGVERAGVLLEGLDSQEQVQALVVDVRERMRRVDGQRA